MNLKKVFFPHEYKRNHFKELDGLRGIAVLIVVLAHGSDFGLNLFPLLDFHLFGRTGVYLFFFLSAYLLDRQIIIALKGNKANLFFWCNYLVRRFLRIYPLFLISLVIYYILSQTSLLPTFITNELEIIQHLLFQRTEHFYWSIPVEFLYYFMSPFILLFIRHIKWDLKQTIIIISISILLIVVYDRAFGLSWRSPIKSLPVFLLGTLIALIEIEKPLLLNKKINFDLIGIIASLIVLSSIPSFWIIIFGFAPKVHEAQFILPYSLLMAGIFLAARYGRGIIEKVAKNVFLRFLGSISFSLYLFHWIFLLAIKEFGTAVVWLDTTLYILLALIFSAVTYIFVEYPLSQIRLRVSLKRKIASQHKPTNFIPEK